MRADLALKDAGRWRWTRHGDLPKDGKDKTVLIRDGFIGMAVARHDEKLGWLRGETPLGGKVLAWKEDAL